MATIKSYTDIKQSKKLAEILPIESADGGLYRTNNPLAANTKYWLYTKYTEKAALPAWSLAALLTILDFPSLTQNKENEWEVCVFDINNDGYIEMTASNPVDACVDMILKLHELNLL